MRRGNRTADPPPPDDGGFSMIATVLSLLATAILTAVLLGTMLKTSGTSNGSISNAPGVAEATALQAQQTLSTGLTAAGAAAANAGGYGSLQPSTLTASNPSITFVTGPSTNSSTVSMAVVSDVAGDAGGGAPASGATGGSTSDIGGYAGSIAAATGAASAGGGGGGGGGAGQAGSGNGGAITLADRSTDGTCWLIWRSAGGTWYGAQTKQASCTAPPLASAPPAGAVTSATIGWQQGSFPGA
jgi:hypothetical protein